MNNRRFFYCLFIFLSLNLLSQNEANRWYFGYYAGLDFSTNPPTPLTNGELHSDEGCASMCGTTGNLLFYTSGDTIWNQLHVPMANGTGLFGHNSTTQSALIVKQPGNLNIYYVFTLAFQGQPHGLRYSVVDMSLAAGMGSVTAKNIPLHTPSTEKLTGIRHCNGTDTWVVSHDINSDAFRCYLLTAAGVNPTAVISNVGSVVTGIGQGVMKGSPNGRKLGVAHRLNTNTVELFDFDAATGIVSNPLVLLSGPQAAYGCEFSPDGSKFYTSDFGSSAPQLRLIQWDLSAGSTSAILASQFSVVANPNSGQGGAIQTGPDGKIYLSNAGTHSLCVINNPNMAGASCNYVPNAINLLSGFCALGLPNFVGSYFQAAQFTHSMNVGLSCTTSSFTAYPPNYPPQNNPFTGLSWSFGDPASGSANTSTLVNPVHNFTGPGTYLVKLVFNYACGADTIKKLISVITPTISITSTSVTCSTLGSATVSTVGGTGPFSYTWMPGAQTGSVANGLAPGIYSLAVVDNGGNCAFTATANVYSGAAPFSGTLTTSNISCNGLVNGTATINLSAGTGGSGVYSYTWSNGSNNPGVSSLAAGVYSVTVSDNLCQLTKFFQITQPPVLLVNTSAGTPTACVGDTLVLNSVAAGGTPGYSYSWTPVTAATNSICYTTQSAPGAYIYTVTVNDINGCSASNTVPVSFKGFTLACSNPVMCTQVLTTLTVSGASSYTWNPSGFVGSSYTVSPGAPLSYTITGYDPLTTCTNSIVSLITVVGLPTISVSGNFTICSGNSATLVASGANTYSWSTGAGSASITVSPLGGSVYTVTGTNSSTNCKASITSSVTVSKCTGINEVVDDLLITLYPNPGKGHFVISAPWPGFGVTLFNQLGRPVYKGYSKENKQDLDLTLMPAGVYFLEFQKDSYIKIIKLVKL